MFIAAALFKQPIHGNNPGAHQQKIGLRRCGIHTHTHTHTHTHIYNGLLLSHKKRMNNAIGRVDLEIIILNEVSRTER